METDLQTMAHEIIDLCKRGAELNYSAKYRKGNLINLPGRGQVVITGDLHGHRRNFEKTVAFAELQNNPETYLIFQEILHGGPEDEFGGCLSFELFFDIVRYQLQFPDQVYLILGNHDTAIINDNNVLKAGKEMNQAMKDAMKRYYADDYESVILAIKLYLLSQPLAVRSFNRIWMSHSLPADRYVDDFDTEVLEKPLHPSDIARPNAAYLLTWGRRHSEEALSKLANLFDVDFFILGHQPQETGFAYAGQNLIILASDHNHGCLISFDLAKSYSIDKLIECIVPLASIA